MTEDQRAMAKQEDAQNRHTEGGLTQLEAVTPVVGPSAAVTSSTDGDGKQQPLMRHAVHGCCLPHSVRPARCQSQLKHVPTDPAVQSTKTLSLMRTKQSHAGYS